MPRVPSGRGAMALGGEEECGCLQLLVKEATWEVLPGWLRPNRTMKRLGCYSGCARVRKGWHSEGTRVATKGR